MPTVSVLGCLTRTVATLAGCALVCMAAAAPGSARTPKKSSEARMCRAHQRAKGPHAREGCVTLESNAKVRIFYRRNGEVQGGRRFARWLRSSRVTALPQRDDLGTVATCQPCLAGRYVAYPMVEGPPGPGEVEEFVVRLNAQTGRRDIVGADGAGGKLYRLAEALPKVTDMALNPAGTMAWIIEGSYQNPNGDGETLPAGSKSVLELPANAATPIVLATSGEISPKSLAITPEYLYWSEAGAPREVAVP